MQIPSLKMVINFIGWNTKANRSGDVYLDQETVKNIGNTTLYAVWEKDEYNLVGAHTFDGTIDTAIDTGITLFTKYIISHHLAFVKMSHCSPSIKSVIIFINLLLPVKVGFTLLDGFDQLVDSYWRPDTYWNFFSSPKVENIFSVSETFCSTIGQAKDRRVAFSEAWDFRARKRFFIFVQHFTVRCDIMNRQSFFVSPQKRPGPGLNRKNAAGH